MLDYSSAPPPHAPDGRDRTLSSYLPTLRELSAWCQLFRWVCRPWFPDFAPSAIRRPHTCCDGALTSITGYTTTFAALAHHWSRLCGSCRCHIFPAAVFAVIPLLYCTALHAFAARFLASPHQPLYPTQIKSRTLTLIWPASRNSPSMRNHSWNVLQGDRHIICIPSASTHMPSTRLMAAMIDRSIDKMPSRQLECASQEKISSTGIHFLTKRSA